MSKILEIEHKYLILDFDRKILRGRDPVRIQQGYLSDGMRIRIESTTKVSVCRKKGNGRVNTELPVPGVSLEEARHWMRHSVGTIYKDRFRIVEDRPGVPKWCWELDVFQRELQGLVFLEVELSEEADQPPPLPSWVIAAEEVTTKWSNQLIARAQRYLPEDERPLVARLKEAIFLHHARK